MTDDETTRSMLEELEGYRWPQSQVEATMNKAPAEEVLRYRQGWSGKLFPVYVVIEKAGIGVDRWASDDYHIACEGDVLSVLEKRTGVIVKMYNSTRWLSLHYEFRDRANSAWQEVSKLEVVTKEEADGNGS